MKKNELLEKEIKQTISEARYVITQDKKDKKKEMNFYLVVVVLVTLAVLLSLLRYF